MFRTYEPTRDRLVAVKVFRLDITPEQARALADALSRAAEAGLFHPSIVEPIAAGVEGTVAYRAEEYVAAETLDVALRHYAPASLDRTLPIVTQLAGAIDFARAAGVGHGALHPRDVFVTPEEARATGFGVVDSLQAVGLRAPVRRPYSAPERIDGREWGTPADVFSLAAMAYELLTARRPAGIGPGIGTLAGASVGNHPAAILAVLERAMDADPRRRFDTALGFAAALEAAARGEQTVPVVAPASAVQARGTKAAGPAAEEPDEDAVAERDADELHHDLVLREREHAEAEAATLFAEADQAEVDPEAEADRLLIDAAAVASDDVTERRLEEASKTQGGQRERPVEAAAPLAATRVPAWDSVRARAADASEPEYRHAGGVVPAQGSRVLPLAAMLSIGLLVGFAVGYGVGSREPVAEQEHSAIDGPAGQPAPAGREFSEQAVPQATGNAAGPLPSTASPPVPADAPPEPAAERRPARTSGGLMVESIPTRAGVVVNGRWRGRTPLKLEALPFGKYAVRVVQPGFVTGQENVALTAENPTRGLVMRLRRQAAADAPSRPEPQSRSGAPTATAGFTGSIYVDSRPQGARVYVDNRPVGTTPLSVPAVPIGTHVVRLELPDHRVWSASARVTAGQLVRVTGSLERIR